MLLVKQVPYFVKKLGLPVFHLSPPWQLCHSGTGTTGESPWTTGETPTPRLPWSWVSEGSDRTVLTFPLVVYLHGPHGNAGHMSLAPSFKALRARVSPSACSVSSVTAGPDGQVGIHSVLITCTKHFPCFLLDQQLCLESILTQLKCFGFVLELLGHIYTDAAKA